MIFVWMESKSKECYFEAILPVIILDCLISFAAYAMIKGGLQ